MSVSTPSIRFYVYVLVDPRKPGRFEYTLEDGRVVKFPFEPFYVGKGTGNRYLEHVRAVKRNAPSINPYKDNKIRSIMRTGLEVLAKVGNQRYTDADAIKYERQLIAAIGRRNTNGPLTNLSNGGEGAAMPYAIRQKISASSRGISKPVGFGAQVAARQLGVKRSADTCKRISESKKGRAVHTEAGRERMSVQRLGIAKSIEHSSKIAAAVRDRLSRKLDIVCPHCFLTSKHIGNMKRYHLFGNCKVLRAS